MEINYKISSTIVNQIYEFTKLYERLYLIGKDNYWLDNLLKIAFDKTALATILMDKTKFANIDFADIDFTLSHYLSDSELIDAENYLATLKNIPNIFVEKIFNLDTLENVHRSILGQSDSDIKYRFRKHERSLEKIVIENGVFKKIAIEVKTKPSEIMGLLTEFINVLNSNFKTENHLILVAIAHLLLVSIHPYQDANGRLARILDNGILYKAGFEYYHLVSLEEYYLENIERYFDLIEKSVETKDLTAWIEFFTAGMLQSITKTLDLLKDLSGNSVDLFNHKAINLKTNESLVLDQLIKNGSLSGAEIAKNLGTSRQSVNIILHKLIKHNLVSKKGEFSSMRFELV